MNVTLMLHHLPDLPDADTDVIVFFKSGPSSLGAWDGERWIDTGGMAFEHADDQVVAWAEFPELSAPAQLWAIHLPGPDDLYAAPSNTEAVRVAAAFNQKMRPAYEASCKGEGFPPVEASLAHVVPWPFGADEHTEALKDWEPEDFGAALLPAQPQAPAVLLTALRFYARSEHYGFDDSDAHHFDTVSGEPQNWLCHDESSVMIEDGTIARLALQGKAADWIDGGEDETPQPIEGEKFDAQPKPLDDPRQQELFSAAIDGALTSGFQGVSPAPEGHWLEPWWSKGRSLATTMGDANAHNTPHGAAQC
jgi:hypothetical protein